MSAIEPRKVHLLEIHTSSLGVCYQQSKPENPRYPGVQFSTAKHRGKGGIRGSIGESTLEARGSVLVVIGQAKLGNMGARTGPRSPPRNASSPP